ncbi:mitogen-activated protein kinase kinase kinase 17-like [Salvia splendens]|uniref:mitogen-activated protein kinase kinase kinase 17-like n=1 Tax=Salvia splendens TaxID=180675 RepID=UPI001C273C66|nr:mitogen-activated protein kinase kinase kinase 17-like [Salvia splendens]
MEYLPARTSADLPDRSEAAVASYAWCLVAALSYLHSRGIVHCDVKGKNVLLGHSPGTAALADFGSAVDVDVDVSSAAGRGSPLWMAPEVIRGERQGREADVWSVVGCTVIEMLTGKPAWGGSVWRIGYSNEVPLFPVRISGAGADFLEKCLRRDYTRRWSCDQLLQHPRGRRWLIIGRRGACWTV